MSRSTFSGPVLVGVDDSQAYEGTSVTTGPDWGFVNMVQSAPIQEGTTDLTYFTGIVIPYKSIITRISALVSVAWASGTKDIHVGMGWGVVPAAGGVSIDPQDKNDLINSWVLDTVGVTSVPTADTLHAPPEDIDNWMNVGQRGASGVATDAEKTDRMITWDTVTLSPSDVGRAVLTVEYCQAVDLSAIA